MAADLRQIDRVRTELDALGLSVVNGVVDESKGAFSLQTGHTWDPQELAECLGSGCSGSFLRQNCKTTLILKTVLDVSQT